jgi:hypothetical protein
VWQTQQDAFARKLMDGHGAVSMDAVGLDASGNAERFSIHRNNVSVGLIDCLQARFPVVCALVGEDFFRAMARIFVTTRPPRTPVLLLYGADLAEFISRFDPARSLPYLADMARLENAWSESYHAAEDRVVSLDELSVGNPTRLARSTVQLHASLRLIRSGYGVGSLWAAHQQDAVGADLHVERPEDLLIVRPNAEVFVHVLQPGAFDFIEALRRNETIEAAAVSGEEHSNASFDIGSQLVSLIASGAVAKILSPYDSP